MVEVEVEVGGGGGLNIGGGGGLLLKMWRKLHVPSFMCFWEEQRSVFVNISIVCSAFSIFIILHSR